MSSLYPSLEPLYEIVREEIKQVDNLIINHVNRSIPLISQVASYLVTSGGKRLRPLLTIASARLCEYDGRHHITLAASVEFLHTATLLHDDVIDESTMRRGRISANKLWGNQASVLVGDFLFSQAFKLMVEPGSLMVLDILAKASVTLSEGEVMQLTISNCLETTKETYLSVISSKTASLFEAACSVITALNPVLSDYREALSTYGLSLGIAFQLMDDILDYSVNSNQTGEKVGNDLREGKITLPVIIAYQEGLPEEQKFWKKIFQEGGTENSFFQALDLISNHKALEKTLEYAKHYGERARRALSYFPPSPVREALDEVVLFIVSREF